VTVAGKLVKSFYNYIFRRVDGITVPDFPLPYSVNRKTSNLKKVLIVRLFSAAPLSGANIVTLSQKPSGAQTSFQPLALSDTEQPYSGAYLKLQNWIIVS
jgi:hypothetical protein